MSASFINKLMLEGIRTYSGIPSSHLTEADVERLWYGFNDEPTWMKNYFHGYRYTTKEKHFPTSKISGDGLIVPSARVKDICGITQTTVSQMKRSGDTVYDTSYNVVHLSFRKMVTQELVVPFMDAPFKSTSCMAVDHNGGYRYFLDAENGEHPLAEALHNTINAVGNELIMGRQLFSWFLYQCQKLNAAGAFATFEWARLDGGWFSVKRLFMLGKEINRAKVEVHWSKETAAKGRRYLREYEFATMVQTNMAMECSTEPVFTMSNRTKEIVVPDDDRADRTESSTDVLCFLRALTITDDGTVAKKEEQVRVVIKHPLQNWGIDLIDKPSSKSQCPELSVASAAPVAGQVTVIPSSEDTTPIAGVLSVLGAKGGADPPAEVAGKIRETGYVRVDKAWKVLFPTLTAYDQNMSLSLSQSGIKHKAGNRGTFPVYRATPVIKVGNAWYNARTLEAKEYGKLTVPPRVRYLELAPSF